MPVDLTELRGHISSMYTDVAVLPRADFHFPTGRPLLERLGYEKERLDRIPGAALESFAGVGYHFGLDPLREGERVLDIGSGAGTDVFYAALAVRPAGSVVGLDMTAAMREKAERSRAAGDFGHTSFVHGFAEELPFAEEAFDVVVSNGVINLSPAKEQVFAGIRRVLSPGGRLMISDIVTGVELPASVRDNCTLWAECIGGAQEQNRYIRLIEQAGLVVEKTVTNTAYAFTQESTINAALKWKVHSVSVLARRPR